MRLPEVKLKLIREGDTLKVWDPLRLKYLVLTPEEYVRQHFVHYLINQLHYPSSILANEVAIDLNGTRRRCDTVVFRTDRPKHPRMIVEYKAESVPITQTVFDQIARYNMVLHADYLVVTNGNQIYCCKLDYQNNNYHFIPKIPDFRELENPVSDN